METALILLLISTITLSHAMHVPEPEKCGPKPPTIAEFDVNSVRFKLLLCSLAQNGRFKWRETTQQLS